MSRFYADFRTSVDLSIFNIIKDDGKLGKHKDTVVINSSTFNRNTDTKDGIFWLSSIFTTNKLADTELLFEIEVSSMQSFSPTIEIPNCFISRIRNIKEDYRLCSSGMLVSDEQNGQNFYFLITDTYYYAMYERIGYFTSAVPLQRITGGYLNELTKISIGFDKIKATVTWYVDDVAKYTINRIGNRLDDQYQVLECGKLCDIIKLDKLKLYIGHFTFLDHQMPNNYAREKIYNMRTKENVIQRSESGLIMLQQPSYYREIYQDIYGVYNKIIPSVSFGDVNSIYEKNFLKQGVVTSIRSIRIYDLQQTVDHTLGSIRDDRSLVTIEDDFQDIYVAANPIDFGMIGVTLSSGN